MPPMAAAQSGSPDDPLALFAQMAPVFNHARCVNCHGGVDPKSAFAGPTGVVHGNGGLPGPITTEACESCHDDATAWALAPPRLSFVGKNTKQLCQLQSQEVRARTDVGYLSHLQDDPLIDLAFMGRSGGAAPPNDPPHRPAMDKMDFLDAARSWLKDGGALCSGWNGFIKQTETFGTHYQFPIQAGTGPSSITVDASAKREMTITLVNGEATAHVDASGHQTMLAVIHDIGPNGPCTSTAITNDDWSGKNEGEASTRIKVAPDGSYAIRFQGPIETTRGTNTSQLHSDCGPLPSSPSPSQPIELVWPAWTFTIDGRLANPRDRRQLTGSITKAVMPGSDADNPQSWLEVSPAGVARSDTGDPLPIHVTTTWTFLLVE